LNTIPSRRNFLKISAVGAVSTLLLSPYSVKAVPVGTKTTNLGLHFYTIRDAMQADVPGTLKKVADIGFKFIELASYADGKFYGYQPSDFRKMTDDLGLDILSSHAIIDVKGITLDEAKRIAEDHTKIGVNYCIHPWIVPEARKTLTSYKKLAAELNKVGSVMKEFKIQFGYHNHNFEFDTVEGKVPYYDILMAELDKDLVTMELDLFWAVKAGQNPVEMFHKYPGRFQILHLKDTFTKEASGNLSPIGVDIKELKKILAAKDIAGMKYLFTEMDATTDGKLFDEIKENFIDLTTKILK
jgi:sugar phosphate isomerase/epimerase